VTAHAFRPTPPRIAGLFEDTLRTLERDPRDRRLRPRALQDRHRGKHAVRLTYEHRIVLILRIAPREIVLLDVGTHDEVYRG